jgi:hypothetical protein
VARDRSVIYPLAGGAAGAVGRRWSLRSRRHRRRHLRRALRRSRRAAPATRRSASDSAQRTRPAVHA